MDKSEKGIKGGAANAHKRSRTYVAFQGFLVLLLSLGNLLVVYLLIRFGGASSLGSSCRSSGSSSRIGHCRNTGRRKRG